MRLLAIDQSLRHAAFSLFEDEKFINTFSWKLAVNDTNEVCYETFYNNINKIIIQEKPDKVICEKMFMGFNAAVFGKLSELTGIIRAICIGKKIPFESIHIASYRAALGIKNNKEIAQTLIKSMYPEIEFNNDDETDATALALGYLVMEKRKEMNSRQKEIEELQIELDSLEEGDPREDLLIEQIELLKVREIK